MNNFLNVEYKGVKGVTVIDSGKPGKNIGILAITHGNEPVGLDIFRYLVDEFSINKNIKKGKLFLIAQNIEGYKAYVKNGDIQAYRYIDDNMNRISDKKNKLGSYEFERLDELREVYKEIDIVLDIHSVSQGDDVFALSDSKYIDKAKAFFDVDTILVDDMGNTGAVIGDFLRNGKEGYGIECGNHISKNGFITGKKSVLNFLKYFECISGNVVISGEKNIMRFLSEIIPGNNEFTFLITVNNVFNPVEAGQIYAIDGDKELKNEENFTIYVGIVLKDIKKGQGAGFIFKKIK